MSLLFPGQNKALVDVLREKKATVFALDCIPRTSRAQAFDVLSSMSNIAGYRAIVEATNHFGRFLTGQITAAGKIPPAKVRALCVWSGSGWMEGWVGRVGRGGG